VVKRNLKTVAEFAASSPFSEHSVRWMIFCAGQNGLQEAGVVVRLGRRVFLDVDAFDRWLDSQQEAAA
jgi:hypothetical protein